MSIEVYGRLQAREVFGSPAELVQLLAQHQMDQAKWARVRTAWTDRIVRDTDNRITLRYDKAFKAAMTAAAPAGGADREPVSLERYAEISGAVEAWKRQGKDINVCLARDFDKMTMGDLYSFSTYWSKRFQQDPSAEKTFFERAQDYERRYLA